MTANLTTSDLDHQIATLTAVLDRLGSELYDLDNTDPTRLILGSAPLTGRTEAAWAETSKRISLLWALYGAARDHLEHIAEQRGTKPLSRSQLDELALLLTSPSLELEPDVVALSPASGNGEPLGTPSRLNLVVDTVSWMLSQITEMLREVTAVWDRILPRLDEGDAALSEVEEKAQSGGVSVPNEVAIGRRSINELRDQARTDPLSIDDSAPDELAALVTAAQASVADATAGRAQVGESMIAVTERLDQLDTLLASTKQEWSRSNDKILGDADRTKDIESVATELGELRDTLNQLGTSTAGNDHPDRQVALLDRRSQLLVHRVEDLHAAVTASLADRDELRSRLDAYRAKAFSLGRSEDIDLDQRYQRAVDVLYRAPCDLDEARRLVESYQRALNPPRPTEDR